MLGQEGYVDIQVLHRQGMSIKGIALILVLIWQGYNEPDQLVNREKSINNTGAPSPGSQAPILFQQAFELLMPPEEGVRLTSSLELFQRVIELDSAFAGGYAGKSIALSFQVLFIKADDPAKNLLQAVNLAERAVDISPEYRLGHAALALAQSLSAESDKALVNVRRVVSIQPRDANANAIGSIALIIIGMPKKAIDLVSESLRLIPNEPRTPYLNILGVAQDLSGDFPDAAASIEKNLARDGPSGPHMEVFLAASYVQMGKDFEARAIVEKLQRVNPEYPVERWLGNFIKSEDEIGMIMDKFQILGISNS